MENYNIFRISVKSMVCFFFFLTERAYLSIGDRLKCRPITSGDTGTYFIFSETQVDVDAILVCTTTKCINPFDKIRRLFTFDLSRCRYVRFKSTTLMRNRRSRVLPSIDSIFKKRHIRRFTSST